MLTKFKINMTAGAVLLSCGLALSAPVQAAPLNVLWYSGGVEDFTAPGDYKTQIETLATPGVGDPNTTTWNITCWDGGAMPAGSYNVLVVASPEGGWATSPDYSGLSGLTAASFGDRVMLTGQDADWHFINGPGPTNFDGPRGFLRDSVNWAGNGTGLGLVDLGQNGLGLCDGGPNFGFTGFTDACGSTENVQIPASEASFPINQGLTSAGLSNWGTSAHDTFTGLDTTLWNGINIDGDDPTQFVTIVTASTAGGGTGAVPEPASLLLLGTALLGLAAVRRRG